MPFFLRWLGLKILVSLCPGTVNSTTALQVLLCLVSPTYVRQKKVRGGPELDISFPLRHLVSGKNLYCLTTGEIVHREGRVY